VAGLVAITPAAGFVLPGPALAIGIVAGAVCFWASTILKQRLRYDDSLDAFGVHGVGGIIGTLATGWFAYGPLTATKDLPEGVAIGGFALLQTQAIAVIATIIYVGAVSWALLKITDALVGLRVTMEEEREGLDIVLHGEQVF
jgi:Amt family ammonium transporter